MRGKKGTNRRKSRNKKIRTTSRQPHLSVPRNGTRGVTQAHDPEGRVQDVKEVHRYRAFVMMVFALASVALLFLLFIFAFATKNADMMKQIMTIVEIGLLSTMGWAGGLGLLQFIGKFHG